jgi:hypothetical protein
MVPSLRRLLTDDSEVFQHFNLIKSLLLSLWSLYRWLELVEADNETIAMLHAHSN